MLHFAKDIRPPGPQHMISQRQIAQNKETRTASMQTTRRGFTHRNVLKLTTKNIGICLVNPLNVPETGVMEFILLQEIDS